jgi:redox-sensitive bicupin YhaK (pirin superfamily)
VGAAGRLTVNGVPAKARDGVVVRDAEAVTVEAQETSEILLADLPGDWHYWVVWHVARYKATG